MIRNNCNPVPRACYELISDIVALKTVVLERRGHHLNIAI